MFIPIQGCSQPVHKIAAIGESGQGIMAHPFIQGFQMDRFLDGPVMQPPDHIVGSTCNAAQLRYSRLRNGEEMPLDDRLGLLFHGRERLPDAMHDQHTDESANDASNQVPDNQGFGFFPKRLLSQAIVTHDFYYAEMHPVVGYLRLPRFCFYRKKLTNHSGTGVFGGSLARSAISLPSGAATVILSN